MSSALLLLALNPAVQAQSEGLSSRKVMQTQRPDYPALVKNARIGGVVRLNAKVLANGTVFNVQVLGGNPILAASAVDAVMKWRYAPAASTTNEIVTFNFNTR